MKYYLLPCGCIVKFKKLPTSIDNMLRDSGDELFKPCEKSAECDYISANSMKKLKKRWKLLNELGKAIYDID